MNIYLFELKRLRGSVLIWASSLLAGIVFFLAFFPAFSGSGMNIQDLLSQYPEDFLAFFGMNSDLPFTELMGYFALTFNFLMIPIAVQSANYGLHILSVEERELTADFLLTRPVSRKKIYKSKTLAVLTALAITDIVIWFASISSLYIFKGSYEVDLSGTILLLISMIPFQLFFLSVGMMLSVLLKKAPAVLGLSMGLGFGFYILSSLGAMISSDFLTIISPYGHFDANFILAEHTLRWSRAWISILIIAVSFIISYKAYLRRNIKSL